MKRKVVAAVLTMAMAGSLLAGCGSSSSDDSSSKSETTTTDESASSDDSDSADSARGDFSGVSITMLNTKSEIESQLEAAAEQWGELTGAKLEVYTIGSGTPSQEVSARYAAKIDGCSESQTTRYIVLPLMRASFTICMFLTITRCFMIYDVNLSLTEGGPYGSTVMAAMYVYQKAFSAKQYGVGQTEAIILFIFTAVIAVSQTIINKRKEVEA